MVAHYDLRLEGDWLRPPADRGAWKDWWESIVASADLPEGADEVTVTKKQRRGPVRGGKGSPARPAAKKKK